MLKHSIILNIRAKVHEGVSFEIIATELALATGTVAKYSGAGTWFGIKYGPVIRHMHPYDREMNFSAAHRNEMRRYAGDRGFVIKGLAARYNVPLDYMYHLRREADKKGLRIQRRPR